MVNRASYQITVIKSNTFYFYISYPHIERNFLVGMGLGFTDIYSDAINFY